MNEINARYVRVHLDMAANYRKLGQRAAAARCLTSAQACFRVGLDMPVAEFIVNAKHYDGSVNAFAQRFLP